MFNINDPKKWGLVVLVNSSMDNEKAMTCLNLLLMENILNL